MLAWLRADGGWRSKAEILVATGFGATLWAYSQRLMLQRALVERKGAGSGVRYRAR